MIAEARSMRIRSVESLDYPKMCELYEGSVRNVGPRRYTPQQVNAWCRLSPRPEILRQRYDAGWQGWLMEIRSTDLVGFCDLDQQGHIGYFYLAAQFSGFGLAERLYNHLECQASAARMRSLKVDASEFAKGFFARRGFELVRRNDFDLGDVKIHNFTMTKTIGAVA